MPAPMATKGNQKRRQQKDATGGSKDDFFSPKPRGRGMGDTDAATNMEGASGGKSKDDIIIDSLERLHAKLDRMEARLVDLETTQIAHASKITTLTSEAAVTCSRIDAVTTDVQRVTEITDELQRFKECAVRTILALEKRTEDLENARRAVNLRILGYPTIAEGKDLRYEVQRFLQEEVLGGDGTLPRGIRRAVRLNTAVQSNSAYTAGTVLVTLHAEEDRDLLLRVTGKKPGVLLNNKRVLFFPDFCRETAARRREFQEIRQTLIAKGAVATLQSPCRLRVTSGGKTSIFVELSAAKKYAESLPDQT